MMTSHTYPAWLHQREGESRDQWLRRTARSCYHCPAGPFGSAEETLRHEIACENTPPNKRLQYRAPIKTTRTTNNKET